MAEPLERKRIRLKDYDYSQNGAYFVTICTKDRKHILSRVVGDGLRAVPQVKLSPTGIAIESSIQYINDSYDVKIEKYVIMPNHVHIIIILSKNENSSGGHGNPPLQDVIRNIKSFTTKRYNEILSTNNIILWQRSYYEHIIRCEQDYLEIWDYIDTNPQKWAEDTYYNEA